MRNILLVILVSLLYSCHNINTNAHELKQLNERITHLEKRMDSLTQATNTSPGGINNMRALWQTNHCAAITKKGTQCKRKSKSNGYCWQHGR